MNFLSTIFKPKENIFNDYVDALAKNTLQVSSYFHSLCEAEDENEIAIYIARMEDARKECDQHFNKITKTLPASFLTPFDKEDIYFLSTTLHSISEVFLSTAKRMVSRKYILRDETFYGIAAELNIIINNIYNTIGLLKHQRLIATLHTNCEALKLQVLACEKMIYDILSDMNEAEPVELISKQDVIQFTELILERIGNVIKTLETFIVKYQ